MFYFSPSFPYFTLLPGNSPSVIRCFRPKTPLQHLVASLLETLDSPELLARHSHLAFAISRTAKRSVFEWAEREARIPGNADRDEPIVPTDDVVSGIPEPLERAVLLRHFLNRCQREGIVTGPDLELLVHIKLEGNFSELNGTLATYSNALRQRIKRLLAKLRKAVDADRC